MGFLDYVIYFFILGHPVKSLKISNNHYFSVILKVI